ncbi:MAG: haloacid dehalogenase [Nitrososphaerota archaeon]|nr:haloacid dehalogenase [Candidatus Bathyarchaeota archaeon]MDW8023293.1 haloacid dehalogenase [Nitrososphaerota archaeon]
MSSLRTILKNIQKGLRGKEKAREKAQADMRKVTSLSKQAILFIHQKRLNEARKLLVKVKEIIARLNEAAKENSDIIHGGLFNMALQEYSEANIFLKLVEESRFITPEEINVPPVDYVLGLADVIGECRRLALDALREGDVEKSEKCLQLMDEIYTELMAMDEAYMLVPGLRRKCDVARKIIETTRGDVTHEVQRQRLEKYLKSFEKRHKRQKVAK